MAVDQVPAYNAGGVLPPYGDSAVDRHRSPYKVTMGFLVSNFGTSKARLELLRGLVEYRRVLFQAGFRVGIQWLDGSFVEKAEVTKGRPPSDIDIVTLFHRPAQYQTDPNLWRGQSVTIFNTFFNPQNCKPTYKCDTFGIDLDKKPSLIVEDVTYWFSLFSHQKITNVWKGLLCLTLQQDSADYTNELLLVTQAEAKHA